MPFPSNVGTNANTLANAWQEAMGLAGYIKTLANSLAAQSAAGTVPAAVVLELLRQIANAKVALNVCAAVPGIVAYAQAQVNDNTLDVAGAFGAMLAQFDATTNWVITNFPKDPNGFLLARTFNADGTTADRLFSTADLANFRQQLTALIATIN